MNGASAVAQKKIYYYDYDFVFLGFAPRVSYKRARWGGSAGNSTDEKRAADPARRSHLYAFARMLKMGRIALENNPPLIWFDRQKFQCANGQGNGCEISDLAADGAVWHIGRCKSNHEKQLAFDLMRKKIPYYLPMVKKRSKMKSNREWRTTLLPLFPTFIFIATDPGRILVSNDRLSYAFRVREGWKLVKELTELKSEIDEGRLSSIQQLREGQRYRVTEGAFRDCEGELDHVDYRGRFGFLRTFMGELQIQAEALELVG